MKKTVPLLFTLMLLSQPAFAQDIVQTDALKVNQKILSDYAENQKWCDAKPKPPEKGQVIIFWSRNKDGQCLIQNFWSRDQDEKLTVSEISGQDNKK